MAQLAEQSFPKLEVRGLLSNHRLKNIQNMLTAEKTKIKKKSPGMDQNATLSMVLQLAQIFFN